MSRVEIPPSNQENLILTESTVKGIEQYKFEQVGLKEVLVEASLSFAKQGGREPGSHKWARQ